MHSLVSATPSRHLKEYVRAYAQRTVTCREAEIVQPVPASLEQVLAFDFLTLPKLDFSNGSSFDSYRIALAGPHTFRRANLRFNGPVETFGVFFQPFGLWQLFGIPIKECTDKEFAASDVLGKPIQELWDVLAEISSFDDRVEAAECFLSSMLTRASDRTFIMNTAHHEIRGRSVGKIGEVARATGLSLRQYERRFAADVGLNPKLYARIMRYQTALDVKLRTPDRSWFTIAHETGYHDQMHMIKEFQRLSSASPDRLLAELGDTRPPALASST